MADVLVLGGGMLGLLTARALFRRGVQVTLVDAPLHRPPASWAGGGILSALFPWRYPDGISRLTLPALAAYQALASEIVATGGEDPQVRVPGMRVLGEGSPEEALQWAARHDVRIERQAESLWMPDIGTVRNPRMLKGLRHLLRKEGVTLLNGVAQRLDVTPTGHEVRLEDGRRLHAEILVVCAGYWSGSLLAPLGIDLDVQAVKGQMLLFHTREPVPDEIRLAPDGYLIPRDAHTLLVGSTTEPGISDQRPDVAAYRQLCDVASRLWPALAGEVPVAQWSGLRPGTGRKLPILSEVPDRPGLFIGTGHFRNGLVCAPESAELLADLVTGRPPRLAPEPYSISPSSSSPP